MNALSRHADRATIATAPTSTAAAVVAEGPAWQAFLILHWAFVVLLLAAGADKFVDVLAPWREYLAPIIPDILGVSAQQFVRTVGAVEILLGLMVAFAPRVGGWLVAGWLWLITLDLLLTPGNGEAAVRDAALALGAVALARLAAVYQDAIEPARPPR